MERRTRRTAAAAVAAAVLLLAGCSAGGSSDSSAHGAAAAAQDKGNPQPQAATPGPGKSAAAAGSGAGSTSAGQPTNRQIAYQAKLSLRVDTIGPARDRAVDLATQAGGYVAGENLRGGPGDTMLSTLVLKVPSESYQKTLDALGTVGTQTGLSSQAEDLTQQIADVDSRVKSMRASVDRVRALMADAKSLTEVVSLESELTRRESDLESLERQQQELSARTSLSTITVDLVTAYRPPALTPVEHEDGFWASVGHALANGWHALVALVHGLLVALAAVLPFLLVLAPAAWLLRRHLRNRPRPTPAPAPAPEWHLPAPPHTEE